MALGASVAVQAQETPVAEDVFGGQARDFAIGVDNYTTFVPTVTMFMATESANSVFYQTGSRVTSTDPTATGTATFSGWQVMPTLDDNAEYGSTIDGLACHGNSTTLLFVHEGSMYSTTPTSTSNTLLDGPGVQDVLVVGDVVLHLRNGAASGDLDLVRGEMDASGVYTEVDVLTFAAYNGLRPKLVLDEATDEIYATFPRQETMRVMSFGDTYDNISSTTPAMSLMSPSPTDPLVEWTAFDVAPDGRWYVMGNSSFELAGTGHDRQVAYSYDHGITWDQFDLAAPGPPGGVFGADIVFLEQPTGSQFSVACGDVVSHAYGIEGTWTNIGHGGTDGGSRANSGFVCADPILDGMIYFTSNQGAAYSMDRGTSADNMCDGMLAIQVNDIDMTADKQHAWVASKSGVRRVSDYLLPTKAWSGAVWPNLDGAPYQCMEILNDDAETVIAGNTRLHKLQADGTWNTVFDPVSGSTGVAFHYGTKFKTVEQSPTDPNIVLAGAIQEGTLKGGLFASQDGGNTFTQIALTASSTPSQDEDVMDIEFVQEGADEVAYVALSYDDGGTGNVFKIVHDASSASFTVTYNFDAADCDFTGHNENTLVDLQLSADGTTLFAAGRDASSTPVLYSKDMDGASNWERMDMTALPLSDYDRGISALAFGNNRVFISLDEDIYFYDFDNAAWSLGYSYPEGTQINVMYYDELLVGTGTGLYAHQVFDDAVTGVLESASPVSESVAAIQAFPNPTEGELQVMLEQGARGEVAILDLTGRVMVSTRVESPMIQLDLAQLPAGHYMLQFVQDGAQRPRMTHVLKR